MSRVPIIKIILYCLLIIVNGCASASSSECLAESDHPYANNFKDTWTVSEPGAAQIRIHFEYIQLASDSDGLFEGYDKVILLDKFDHKLGSYGSYYGIDYQDFWTEWYTGDTLKVKLLTDGSRTDYGFKIDKIETRPDKSTDSETMNEPNSSDNSESLPESDSPYANNFVDTWTVSEPGASQIRLHFEYIQLAYDDDLMFEGYDKVILLDKNGHELKTYGDYDGVNYQNFWTDWYTGDTLKVKLVTDGSRTDYGFKVDDVETKLSEPNILTTTELVSSDNSYTLGQPVTLTAKIDTPSQTSEEPSGTVTFMDGTTLIGTEDVNSGKATLTTSSLSASSHSITAIYSGDINFKSSTSSPFTLTIQEPIPEIEQPISREQSISKEDSSAEQNSLVRDIIDIVFENPLISSIVGGLILLFVEMSIKKK